MIIDASNNEIKSDDGKIKLATINSLTIYRGDKKEYESASETEIVEVDKKDLCFANSINEALCNNSIKEEDIKPAPKISLFAPSSFPATPTISDNQSVLNSMFKLFYVAYLVKRNSKKDRKEFKSKIYLLKDKKKAKRIRSKLSQCINKNINVVGLREELNKMFKTKGE